MKSWNKHYLFWPRSCFDREEENRIAAKNTACIWVFVCLFGCRRTQQARLINWVETELCLCISVLSFSSSLLRRRCQQILRNWWTFNLNRTVSRCIVLWYDTILHNHNILLFMINISRNSPCSNNFSHFVITPALHLRKGKYYSIRLVA